MHIRLVTDDDFVRPSYPMGIIENQKGEINKIIGRDFVKTTESRLSNTIKTPFQAEIPHFDILFIAAPNGIRNGYFNNIDTLACGIPVMILGLNDYDAEHFAKLFRHIAKLVIVPSLTIGMTDILQMAYEWSRERAAWHKESIANGMLAMPKWTRKDLHTADDKTATPHRPSGELVSFEPYLLKRRPV